MAAQLEYRPFQDEDFDAVARILQGLWHDDRESEVYNRLETGEDLTSSLMRSTFALTAVLDGAPVGFVSASAGTADPVWSARWTAANASHFSQMEAMDPAACADHLRFIRIEHAANARMEREAGLAGTPQLMLLIADASLRGKGVGRSLFAATLERLRAMGERRLYLATDSCCNWRFYEAVGMHRAATYLTLPEEQGVLADEMYLYAMDL